MLKCIIVGLTALIVMMNACAERGVTLSQNNSSNQNPPNPAGTAPQPWSPSGGLTDASGFNNPMYNSTIRMGDVTGDGKAELCYRASNGYFCMVAGANGYVSTITGPPFSDAGGWSDPKFYSTIRMADVNGDGKSDICARGATGFYCWLSNGAGFPNTIAGPALSDAGGWADVKYYSTIQMADVNGDGKADVCARSSTSFDCWLSNGTGFPTSFVGVALSDASGYGNPIYYETIRMADINGDGKADVCTRNYLRYDCYISNGAGFPTFVYGAPFSDASGFSNPMYYTTIKLADINGDGKADVCARNYLRYDCFLSDGTAFPSGITGPSMPDASGYNDPKYYSTIQLADINQDNKADVCVRASDAMHCYLSAGNNFNTHVQGPQAADSFGWGNPEYYSTITVADVNGDGKPPMACTARFSIR
jgi:hypothetical protein